jgi:hypothetical protein
VLPKQLLFSLGSKAFQRSYSVSSDPTSEKRKNLSSNNSCRTITTAPTAMSGPGPKAARKSRQ